MSKSPGAGRLASLDILRTLAVVLVLGRHLPDVVFKGEPRLPGWTFFAIWRLGGWVGVDVFFVLSGFLVSGLLFREARRHGRIRPGYFLVRRGLKIYPAFYFLIAVTVLTSNWVPPLGLIGEVFFVQNFGFALWNHTWSLAVEEHFYLAVALLFPLFLKYRGGEEDPFATLPRIVFRWIALPVLGLRLIQGLLIPYGHVTHLFNTVLRIDSLAFGVVLAYAYHVRHDEFLGFAKTYRRWLLAGGILCLVPPFVWPLYNYFTHTLGLTVFYLGSGMLLMAMLAAPPPGPFGRVVAFVGRYSYSIYLWHMPVNHFVFSPWFAKTLGVTALSPVAGVVIYMFGTIVVGIVLAIAIEQPVLAVRDGLFPSRSRHLGEEGV